MINFDEQRRSSTSSLLIIAEASFRNDLCLSAGANAFIEQSFGTPCLNGACLGAR